MPANIHSYLRSAAIDMALSSSSDVCGLAMCVGSLAAGGDGGRRERREHKAGEGQNGGRARVGW